MVPKEIIKKVRHIEIRTKGLVNDYLKTMSSIGVDYVEVGFRSFQTKDFKGPTWYTTDSYLESFELACQLHTLKQQVQEYVIEEAMKEQEKIDQAEEIDARDALLLDPSTDFDTRFEAVMTDMLQGRHVTQIEPDDPGLYREPVDNEEENSTKDF